MTDADPPIPHYLKVLQEEAAKKNANAERSDHLRTARGTSSSKPSSSSSDEPKERGKSNYYETSFIVDDAEELIPPENFALVAGSVYRSSMPKRRNFPFLHSMKLKSVLTLILEQYPESLQKFLDKEGVKLLQFGIPGNKEPFVYIPDDMITQALLAVMDTRNHPMLIHCNKGKHRTGCLVGCIRKLQQWSLTSIFDEYRRFSFPKSRSMDQQFMELYDPRPVWEGLKKIAEEDEEMQPPKWIQ